MQVKTFKDLFNLIINNVLFFLILAVLIIALYANVANGEFLSADDYYGIVTNPDLRDLNLNLKTLSIHPIYYAVLYSLFGLNSTAFHIGSIIFHIINTWVVFLLLFTLFNKKISQIATLIFASHPVAVEAISWVSGSGYLINALFIIPSLLFFFLYRKSENKRFLLTSGIIYALGLTFFRGPWILVCPFLLVVIDQFIVEKKISLNPKIIKNYLPHGLLSLAFAIYLLAFQQGFTERYTTLERDFYQDMSNTTPLLNRVPYTIYMAFKLLVFPKDLSIYQEAIVSQFEYVFLHLSFFAFVALIIRFMKTNRAVAGLLLLIPITTLPSFSPVVIAWLIAERYLYIGLAFFGTLVTLLLYYLEKKLRIKDFAMVTSIIIILAFSIRTVIRNKDFQNNKNLWHATEKIVPNSYRVYNNLGDVYATEKNYDLAIQYFATAVKIKPDYAEAVHNIGHTFIQKGDIETGRKYIERAVQMNPRLYQSWYILGALEYGQNNYATAREYFMNALSVNPKHGASNEAISTMDKLGQ